MGASRPCDPQLRASSGASTVVDYCRWKTIVRPNGWPSPLVPCSVTVSVWPSADSIRSLVRVTLPAVLVMRSPVFVSMRLEEAVMAFALPANGYSLPSKISVYELLDILPSAATVRFDTFTPWPEFSIVSVRLLGPLPPGNFDRATSSVHVPISVAT